MKVPANIQEWLDARALTVVPIAAAELLDAAVEARVALVRAENTLRLLARGEGDGAMANLLAVKGVELDLLGDRCDAAEAALRARMQGSDAATEIRAWQQAERKHQRSLSQ